jgi:hypothetical protein
MFTAYPTRVEQAMQLTYSSLNERQRRLFAATEALKLGHGSIKYRAQLLGCHRKTIQRGLKDLRDPQPTVPLGHARKKGVAADRA